MSPATVESLREEHDNATITSFEHVHDELWVLRRPATTHVFLCGNPAMIGLPAELDGGPRYPEPTGVVELLVQRGFTLDRRKSPGNIHYEEYW